jgi:hypothetical protein
MIGDPCPFCDESVAYVVRDEPRRRYTVKVVHPCRSCPAVARGAFQDRASPFLTGLLELYGIRADEYLDGELAGWHDWR